jgi:magnesium-transporting ATPase (P-type)
MKELVEMLGKQPMYLPCFHFKHPIMKVEKSRLTLVFFLTAFITSFVLIHLFVLPFHSFYEFLSSFYTFVFLLTLTFFSIASCIDPGVVQESQDISFLKLNQYFDSSYLCPTCKIFKPEDARHCYICNKCV